MKERKMELTREHYHTMILHYFKIELDHEQCYQHLQLAYRDEVPSCATAFRYFTKFHRGWTFFLNEEHTGKILSAVIPENAH